MVYINSSIYYLKNKPHKTIEIQWNLLLMQTMDTFITINLYKKMSVALQGKHESESQKLSLHYNHVKEGNLNKSDF